jgi:ubiquitin related modifier 1
MALRVRIELGGGLELLFGNHKRFDVDLPAAAAGAPPDLSMSVLLQYMRDNLLQQRPELFLAGGTARPGILVLINDVDWELEGQLAYVLAPGDVVSFISTLHGG